MKILIGLFTSLLFTASLFSQNIWYVNIASTAISPTGDSWELAFTDLNDALAAAHAGDEIWVAQGVYKPTDGNDRMVYFTMASDVALYGGFSGSETEREQRNWDIHESILSGDIGVEGDSSDNSYTVLYAYNTLDKTRVDGFTIENGYAINPDNSINGDSPILSGGGIYVDGYAINGTWLGIYNCMFRHNKARYQGGAIYANGKDGGVAFVRLDSCVFEENVSVTYGGGLALENSSPQPLPLEITNCVFRGNSSGTEGGAVWVKHHQAISFDNCLFEKNKTILGNVFLGSNTAGYPVQFYRCDFIENETLLQAFGSCIVYGYDYSNNSDRSLKLKYCRFWKNTGRLMYLSGVFEAFNASFEHCSFIENLRFEGDGGILSVHSHSLFNSFDFTHCLFYDNKGLEFSFSSHIPQLNLTNCIILDNMDSKNHQLGGKHLNLSNCIVNHSTCQDLVTATGTATCTNVQFETDPLFIAPGAGPNADFHLQPCSPAINAGLNAILDSFNISTDFDGNPRIQHGLVDVGPYETELFLSPEVITMPSCAGESDGAIELSGNICAPYSLSWDNGIETGTALTGLSAGNYTLTITDANGLTIEEALTLPAQDSLVLEAAVEQVSCPGLQNGILQLSSQGGTQFPGIPAYLYAPDNPETTALGAGIYSYTVTDANGCSAELSVAIESPPPFEFFFTVQNASGLGADGAILFDSITGGWNGAPTPDDVYNLAPGYYTFSVTDVNGCTADTTILVDLISAASEPAAAFDCKIYPNPGFSDAPFFIETIENEAFTVKIYGLWGNYIGEQSFVQNAATLRMNGLPPGFYRLEILGESGRRALRPCLVLGR